MPVTYRIDPQERLVYLEMAGEVTYEEWEGTMLAILADPSYRPGFGFLIDRRAAPVSTPDYIRRVVAFNQAHRKELGGGRRAVVVNAIADFSMGRMYATLSEMGGVTAAVFLGYEQARRWILEQPE